MSEPKLFSVNFDEITDCLDSIFFNDEKDKSIIQKAGFTEAQVKIINTLIISALKAYDLEKQK